MVVLLIGGNGLPHQSADWFAMTAMSFRVSNHPEVFAKEDCHFAARDFVSSQGLKPQEYFVYFKASITPD